MTRFGWMAVLALGCAKQTQPVALVGPVEQVLERARARSIPDPARSRVHVHIAQGRDEVKAASVGGGVVIDRPGHGRLDLMHPVAGRLYSAVTDGEVAGVLMMDAKRHLVADHAEEVLSELTGGLAGVDDLLAVLVGDLPLDEAEVLSRQVDEGALRVELAGPDHTRLVAWLEPDQATVRRLEGLDAEGAVQLTVVYGPYTEVEGRWLPESLHLEAPAAALVLELRYDRWVVPDTPPEVFDLSTPEGFAREPLEDVLRGLRGP
ncbi:MAG: DUF4292 domain-containing protein [Deltaproteobacteria bacterium]|nr:DUF4292 domain-containing protein [Deltaproteobacteria bacterium]